MSRIKEYIAARVDATTREPAPADLGLDKDKYTMLDYDHEQEWVKDLNKYPQGYTLQEQVEDQLQDINPNPSGGLVSVEGVGWRETYKVKGEIVGSSVFEIETDIITQTPTDRSNFVPSFQMTAGHKALMPVISKKRKGPSVESSLVTIVERDTDGTLRRKWTEPRADVFGRIAGHYRDRVDGIWFKKPAEEEPKALKSIPLEEFSRDRESGEIEPSAYQQIIDQRRGAGLQGISTALAWQQGDLFVRAYEEEQAVPATIHGSVARRLVTVDTFDRNGKRVRQDVYEDHGDAKGIKLPAKHPKSSPTTYEEFINKSAASMRGLQFEVELTEEELQHLTAESRRRHREQELYDVYPGLAFLAVLGAEMAETEELPSTPETLSQEEALDMLAGVPNPADYNPRDLVALRAETFSRTAHLVKAVKDIYTEIGRANFANLVNTMMARYLNITDIHAIPIDKQDLNYGWLVEALAHERLKAERPSYARTFADGLAVADPAADSPEANQKRFEIVEHRVGQRFLEQAAPVKEGWAKTIDDDTLKETYKKEKARKIAADVTIKLERSIREPVLALVNLAIASESDPKQDGKIDDRIMAEMGKMLATTASL